MIYSVSVQLLSFVYLCLILSVFIYKKKSHNFEGIMYQVLLILTMIVIVFDVASNILIAYHDQYAIFNMIAGKGYLVASILWCAWLTVYVFHINSGSNYKNLMDIIKNEPLSRWGAIFTIAFCVAACVLKTIYVYDEVLMMSYQSGEAIYFTFIISFIYMGFTAIYMIYNPKKISFVKRFPIFVFLLLALISVVLQWMHTSIHLISSVMAFVMLFIYFTMENPDQKIISELEKDKEEVEEASKAKTDFLSNMSHDIRTPMNAIIGFSESLLMESLTDPQKSEVQNIYEAANTLLAIINNILDVSRIESGKEEKNERPYEFRKIIMQITSVITSKIDNNKIHFNINIDKNVPTHFIGDELKIYQILMNLLSNAVKYTNEGSITFDVSAEIVEDNAKLKFIVSDTGIGIKQEDFDKMFVKFSRINNPENDHEIEGTGLGLVITKSLTELLGGTIDFASEYGKGTTFTVIIPQKIYYGATENTQSNVRAGLNVSNVHFDGSLYDVLIVDDNSLNLKVAQRILSDYKFQITLANSGEEAIAKIQNGARYDLIFLDHMMPGMDGIQTLKELKRMENVKIPPVIALTANAMVGMKEMYLSEGFDGYISKPINREELQDLLNNIFCRK